MATSIERRDAAIVRAVRAGEGTRIEIGRRYGVSGQRIGQILQRAARLERIEAATAADEVRRRAEIPARRRARLVPTRIVAMTPFGPDVEHADPAIAAADAAPWRGGRYPKAPIPPSRSLCGSPAAMCAEH